ncbi:MAG TPA: hypothetical protein VEW42_05655, partial [Candidatus Eisenbacteria bacterium]|nr:hypothetical protein [Candidatus Eisenbacteria bacterium]
MDKSDSSQAQKLISLHDASQILGVSTDVLLNWNEHQILKPTITQSGEIGYTQTQINQFLKIQQSLQTEVSSGQIAPDAESQDTDSMQSRKRSFIQNFFRIVGGEFYYDSFSNDYYESKEQPQVKTAKKRLPSPRILSVLVVLCALLSLAAFTQKSRISFMVDEYEHTYQKQTQGQQVLAAETSKLQISGHIIFALPVQLKEDVTLNKNLLVEGTSVFKGNITAPNILYGIKAGTGITISNAASQTPTISVEGIVNSFQGQTGDVTLTPGSDIAIDGTTISDVSTLATVISRGSCGSCVTDAMVANSLTLDAGSNIAGEAITSGVISPTVGGTGLTTYNTGDILYGSASNILATLPVGTPGQFLSISASNIPVWANVGNFAVAIIKKDDVVISSPTNTLNFFSGDFNPVVGPSGQVNFTLNPILNSVNGVVNSFTVGGNLTATGDATLAGAAGSSTTIGNATGNLIITSNGLQVSAAGGITIPNTQTLTVGTIGLSDAGVSNLTSGANLVGVFDNFVNSSSNNLQQVLKDLDSSITSAGVSPFTIDTDGTYGNFIRPTTMSDHLVLGGDGTVAGSTFFFNATTGVLNLGTDNAGSGGKDGVLTLFSSGNGVSDPTISASASGNLLISNGNVGIGANATDVDADNNPFKLEVHGSIGPDVDATYDLGSPTRQYRNLYLTGQTTSGGNITIANATPAINFIETDNSNYQFSLQTDNSTFLINNDTTGAAILSANAAGNIDLAGGSGSTGCTITNATGDINCSGTGTFGTGLTVTTGAVNITGTSGAINVAGLGASSINTGGNNLVITSGNFNTTNTGINNTAIGLSMPSTAAFTTLAANSTVTLTGLVSASGTTLCLTGANQVSTCSGGGGLQTSYDIGNTILTTTGRNIDLTLYDNIASGGAATSFSLTNQGTAPALVINDTNSQINNSIILESNGIANLTLDELGNATTSGTIVTTNATSSTSPSKGAIVAAGGVGVGENLTVGQIGTFGAGLTVTTGAVNITGTSGTLTLAGLGASSISTGGNTLTFTSSNFNTTATGINNTAIGATTPSTGAFTVLSSTGDTTVSSGAGANTVVGNATGTFALTSTGLNVTTGGALTGVSSLDTIAISPTALTFTSTAPTISVSTPATNINIDAGTTGAVNIAGASTGDVNLAGGYTSTGCTVTNSSGDLLCSGTISSNGNILSNLFQRSNGALSPTFNTDDLLLGSTATSAARFAFSNVAFGIPTASLSAGITGATYVTADGTLATTNSQPLILGSSTTGAISLGADATERAITIGNTTGATALNLNAGSGNINFYSASNTLTNAGNLTLAGSVQAGTTGTFGTGLTVTTGAVNITGTSGALSLTGLTASSINTGANALTFTSSNFNTTASGINSTAIGANTPSTGAFTTLSSTGDTTLSSGAGANTVVGNATGTFALTSTGLNVTTGGVLTGVASIDSITTSPTALTFTSTAPSISVSTPATNISLDAGTTGVVNIAGVSTGDVNIAGGTGNTGCTVYNATGNLDCTGTITSGGSVLTNLFQRNNGALSPTFITDDLLLGATSTSSAKFAFYNVGSGIPTASISAGIAGGLYLTADGTLSTTANQALTLGTSTTGAINVGSDGTPRTITVGNTTGATALNLNAGSGNINFYSASNTLDASGNLTIAGTFTNNGTINTDTLSASALTFSGANPTISPSTVNTGLTLQQNGNGQLTLGSATGTNVVQGTNFAVNNLGAITAATTTNTINGAIINSSTQTFASHQIIDSGVLTLATSANGNLTLTPNGTGQTILTTTPVSSVFVGSSSNTPAILSVSGGIGNNAALNINNNNNGDLITASSSGVTKFTVNNGGGITTPNFSVTSGGVATLGTANSTTGQLVFTNSAATGTTTFQAGNQGASNITYTLPTSAPAADGSVLSAQTNGILTWAAASCPTCLVQVPPTTSQNTVTPTANNTVSLTLNGTTGTGTPHIFDVANSSQVVKSFFDATGAFNTTLAIVAPTATNTINGLVIDGAGGLSGTLTSITPSGAFTVGSQSQNLTLQGAVTSLTSTDTGVTNTLTFATPASGNKTITIPNADGTVAVSASGVVTLDANGDITCPDCLTTGTGNGNATGVILAPSSAQTDATTNNSIFINKSGVGSLFNLTQSSTLGGAYSTNDVVFTRNLTGGVNAKGGSLLSLSDSSSGAGANTATGILITEATPVASALYTGNFIDLQRADVAGGGLVSKFSVSSIGNVLASGTINGLTITNNGTNTLNIAAGKSFVVNNSLTLNGTDATSFTFPTTTGGTVITSNAPSQSITSAQTSGTLLSLTGTSLTNTATGAAILLSNSSGDQIGLSIQLTGATTDTTNALVVNNGIADTASISKAGSAQFIGVNSGIGLLQGSGGFTLTGATNINTTGTAATNIGTGAGSNVTLGNATGTLTLGGFSTDKGILYTNGSGVVAQTAQGAANTVLHGNGTGAPTFSIVDLTADVGASLLPVTNGGTGLASLTLNGVVLGNGSSTAVVTAAGNAYEVLRVPAGGGTPAFGSIDLSQGAAVTGVLGIANGGTNANGIGSAGSIAFSNSGTSYGFSGQGTAGQALLSGGINAPTWTTGTLALGQNFITAGASALTLTTGGSPTNATLPTGNITLADLESAQTFSGDKTFSPTGTNNISFNMDFDSPLLRNFYSATDTSSGSAYIVNNSATSGTVGIVGESYALVGTDNGTGANTTTGINFEDVTAHTNNTFDAINFGTGLTNFLNSSSIKITGAGAITGATGVSTTTLNTSSTVNFANLNSGAGSALCTDGSFNLVYCVAGSSTATLQSAYNLGNIITTSSNKNVEFYLANSIVDSNFYIEEQGTPASGSAVIINNASGTPNTLLALQNNRDNVLLASSSGTLSLLGNNAADITTIMPGYSLTIQPIENALNSGTGGNVFVSAGNETGTTSTGGSITINAGSGTSTNGAVNIGTSNTSYIALGGVGVNTQLPTLSNGSGSALCRNAITGYIVVCSAGSSSATLQSAYDQGNTILTTDNRDINFTLANTAVPSSFIVTNEGTATTSAVIINDTNTAINSTLFAIESDGSVNLGIDELGNATTSGSLTTTGTGTITSANGLTVQANGANITGGIANNDDGITNTGSIAGATDISASGILTLSGASPLTFSNTNPVVSLATAGNNGVLTIKDAEVIPNTLLTLTDAGTTGNLSVTGDLNASNNVKTNGTTRIDNNGNLVNIPTIQSGAITTTGLLTFNGVGPTDITTGANEELTLVANGAGKINLNDTVLLADPTALTQGSLAICRNINGELATCSANATGVTLQEAYQAGNTIDANNTYGSIAFTLDAGSNAEFTATNSGSATNTFSINDTDSGPTHTALNILSAGVSKLTISELGTLTTSGNIATTGTGTITSAGALTVSSGGIANNGGGITGAGAITGGTGITSSGTISFTGLATNGVVYTTGGTGTLNTEAQLSSARGGTSADLSGATQGSIPYFSSTGIMSVLPPTTAGYVLVTNGVGANPSWTNPAALGTNFWNEINGALSPKNITDDLLLGGNATSSATFAFYNVASGTPTASISAGVNGGIFISASGTVATTANQTLTLGNNTTGAINFFNTNNLLTSSGNLTIAGSLTNNGTINTNTFTASALTFSGANPTISPSTTNTGLTLQQNGNGTLTLGTTNGTNVIQGTNFAVTSSGNITAATSVNTINGIIINSGAVSNVSSLDTISVSATALGFAGTGAITSGAATNLSLTSGTSGTVTVDSGTTGTVNLGTGNNAKTINIGTGNAGNIIHIGDNNTVADTITLGSALDTVSISSNAFNLTSLGAISGVTTLNLSGAITGATSINTINGAIINGSTQTFASHAISDTGALTIATGGNGNLSFTPDKIGNTVISSDAGGNAALIVNKQASIGDIFTASSSGVTKFTLANNGDITASGAITGLTGISS